MHQSRNRLLVSPERWLLVVAAIATVLCALCIPLLDQPFARWIRTRETYPAIWNEGIGWLEYLGGIEPWKWLGVFALCEAIVITRAGKLYEASRAFMFVALVHLLTRNITFWMKFGTGRLRPSEWFKRPGDTFFRDGGFSFPSGHVTLFATILIPVAVMFPRTRPYCAIVVLYVMCARVAVNAHFLSDVLGGLALTCAVTWLCARWIHRLALQTPPASPQ